jgi:hypothetical protein
MFDSSHGEIDDSLENGFAPEARRKIYRLNVGLSPGLTGGAQFGLAAHEAAALSGAVTRFNPPAS